MVANLTIIVDAVADCLQVARLRDNAVNGPGLSFAVRPGMEVAGQVAWLLDDRIDGAERGRRYLAWRFSDLRQQRLLLADFRPDAAVAAAQTEVEAAEQSLLGDVTRARWQARPTAISPNGHIMAAVLLDPPQSPKAVPKINELVRLVSSTPSTYSLLSVPAHGVRFGAYHGLETEDDPLAGVPRSRVRGSAIDINLFIELAVLAHNRSVRLLAGWNGLDAARFHRDCRSVTPRAGI